MKFMAVGIAIMLLVGAVPVNAVTKQQENSSKSADQTFPEVRLSGTQERLLQSQIVDQEYKLWISLPRNYAESDQHYPVIYLLDAQWDFTMMISIYGQLVYDGYIPDAILVGVTWGGDNPNAEILRVRDFTPTTIDEAEGSGGADAFRKFFKQELIPFIGREYRSNDERVLVGSSLGGLFTLYTLFTDPGLFTHYLPTATSAWWDNEALFSYAEDYLKRSHQHPAKLYSAAGEYDGVLPVFIKMQAFFEEHQPAGLDFKIDVFDNLGHSGIKANGNTRGLQYLFAPEQAEVSPANLTRLTGKYKNQDGAVISVSLVDDKLEIISPDGAKEPFYAISDTEFQRIGASVQARFHPQKNPALLEIKTFDGLYVFTREE